VDPDNRLVASELERRWNEKLERVSRLEQAHGQAEQEAPRTLIPEERKTIQEFHVRRGFCESLVLTGIYVEVALQQEENSPAS
jgi:hypothetical protein